MKYAVGLGSGAMIHIRSFKKIGQSQSHFTTDDQSVSPSLCRAPSVAHDQILITV
jgi:hypothetical protein